MPLAFDSTSHGTIAFGFFNIRTDMLLLAQYFFFAADFCDRIHRLGRPSVPGGAETTWPGYIIEAPEKIGDLAGAINGYCFTGFIGEVYRRFPFPENPERFKQHPDGFATRSALEDLIAPYGRPITLKAVADPDRNGARIAEYRFDRTVFGQLIAYVWKGGYPRWDGGVRPGYVLEMRERIARCRDPLFHGLALDR